MSNQISNIDAYRHRHADSRERARDAGGYQLFSAGDLGAAHVTAHRLFDTGRIGAGRRLLGAWLAERTGSGSEWVHLQFHMALFELELGDWDSAFARYDAHVGTAAAATDEALTDAPALLWRLALAAPKDFHAPWAPVFERAMMNLEQPSEPFVEAHHLLAIAGAGQARRLEAWLEARPQQLHSPGSRFLHDFAIALRAYATARFDRAARDLDRLLPRLSEIGGSRAQQQLFHALAADCHQRNGLLANAA